MTSWDMALLRPVPDTKESLPAGADAQETRSFGEPQIAEIQAAVRRACAFRNDVSPQDMEDIVAEAVVAAMERYAEAAPENASALLVTIARRACSAWARRRYPAFHRLRVRLRYLLQSDTRFRLWEGADGAWYCCLAEQRELQPGRVEFLPADFDSSLPPADALQAMFERAGKPLAFNTVAKTCARLWSIEDAWEVPDTDAASLPEPSRMEDSFVAREQLRRIWAIVLEMPVRQRLVLLLNLRADDGGCAVSYLPATGIASLREIAAALEMPTASFAELWGRLPLSDFEIAEFMQMTRQQVINLRRNARDKLRRTLEKAAGQIAIKHPDRST